MYESPLIIAYASSNILVCGIHVHSALADVSFLGDSHTSAVLGENLPKYVIIPRNACSSFFVLVVAWQ